MKYFGEHSKLAARALQCYLILIGCAARRETITYSMLSEKLGYTSPNHAAGVMGGHIGPIMFWCQQNNLPPLTSLVVRDDTGLPGEGLTASRDFPADQQKVFKFDWFSIFPPTMEELEVAARVGRAA